MAGMIPHAPAPGPRGVGPAEATGSDAPTPRLHVTTVPLAPTHLLPHLREMAELQGRGFSLVQRLPEEVSAAWIHGGEGMLASGTAHRISTRGRDRFADASAQWRALTDQAVVEDRVGLPGSGLIAFGSFSYSAASPRPSSLVVPRAVLGVHDGRPFLTTIADRPIEDPLAAQALFPEQDVWGIEYEGRTCQPVIELEIDPAHTPDEYQHLVSEALDRIRAGRARKTVLSETAEVTGTSRGMGHHSGAHFPVPGVLRALARRYPTTWTYHVDDVVGASPEMLAQTENDVVFSRVLAGTRPVADGGDLSPEDEERFLADPKERAEHAFAIDSVTAALATVATDVRASPEPFVLRLPGLEHLASDVSATARPGVTSLDIAAALHPSAAVSGTPREDADAMIADLEPLDRGGYAGPVGWMDADGSGQWAIALRMAHIVDASTMRLQAGGGLVDGSDPVTEHAEVLAKMRPMLTALRDAGR